ncbi:hypothetical protein BDQ17DRAFT_1353946 [Cyathus striatus]|nr:hypothetical protein BDQ17DRAFT_1353946 [Cyathus striatus]
MAACLSSTHRHATGYVRCSWRMSRPSAFSYVRWKYMKSFIPGEYSQKPEMNIVKCTESKLNENYNLKSPVRKRRYRTVKTLDLSKACLSEVVDLSTTVRATVMVDNGTDVSRIVLQYYALRPSNDHHRISWPDDAQGFLYFKQFEGYSPMTGEVRFRPLDSSGNLATKDMLLPSGIPWRLQLSFIAGAHRPLAHLLIKDGLVSPEVMNEAARLYERVKTRRGTDILFSLEQPFPVAFDTKQHKFFVSRYDELHRINISYVFCNNTGRSSELHYSGSAMVHFEISNDPEHSERTLVLRVAEILKPVQQLVADNETYVVRPKAGELLLRKRGKKVIPWTLDLDDRTADSVKHLSIFFT